MGLCELGTGHLDFCCVLTAYLYSVIRGDAWWLAWSEQGVHITHHVPAWSQSFINSAREICIRSLPRSLSYLCPRLPLAIRKEWDVTVSTHGPCGDSSLQPYSFPFSSSFTSKMLSRARFSHVLLTSLHPLSLCRICSYSPFRRVLCPGESSEISPRSFSPDSTLQSV